MGKNAGRKSGQEPRVKLKAPPTGLYNVIENRLLLKQKQKQKTKNKEKTKQRLVHVIYAALSTPDMDTHGAPGQHSGPVVSRSVKIFISAFFAGSFDRNNISHIHFQTWHLRNYVIISQIQRQQKRFLICIIISLSFLHIWN